MICRSCCCCFHFAINFMIFDRPDVANFVPTKVDTNRLSCECFERGFLAQVYLRIETVHKPFTPEWMSTMFRWHLAERSAFKLFDYVLHLLANWHLITGRGKHTNTIRTKKKQHENNRKPEQQQRWRRRLRRLHSIRSRVFIFRSIVRPITSWIKCAAGIYYYYQRSSTWSFLFGFFIININIT